eukprot:m.25475 g.25475  ORF g.25475 m.25475 type:complete len:161 (-) comp11605_c0_seq1:496-978(-)
MGEEFTIIFERAAVARALLNVCASGLDYQEDTYDCICDTDNMTMKVLAYDWHIRSGVTFQISQAAGELTAILTTGTPVGLVHIPVATMLPHAITATDPHQGDPTLKMVIPYPPPASGPSSAVIEYQRYQMYTTKSTVQGVFRPNTNVVPIDGDLVFKGVW